MLGGSQSSSLALWANLAMSLASMGFHYSVASYASALFHVLRPGGQLILNVNRESPNEGQDQLTLLAEAGFSRCISTTQNPYTLLVSCVRDE